MKLADWKSKGHTFSFRGQRLFFAEEGRGEPLLLLHAYPTASWGWHKMWPALAPHFHLIAPDLPGSGFSDKPPGGRYDIVFLADAVEGLLSERGIKEYHILAHAYGVTTAQELLARDIEGKHSGKRIRSACFINGGLFPEATRPTLTQKLLMTPLGAAITRFAPAPFKMFRKKLRRNFGPRTQPANEELREFWELLTFQNGHRLVPKTLQYLRERFRFRERWVGALENADIPLCLINGAADPVSGKHVPEVWQRLLPERDLIQLDPQIGHYPPLEDPEGTLNAVLAFFENVALRK